MNKEKTRGLNLQLEKEHSSEDDWVFGAGSLPCITDIALVVRGFYLPKGERQNIGQEKSDCTTRSAINLLETKFNWLLRNGKLKNVQWLTQQGYIKDNHIAFSDRYIAKISGTTRQGNSLIAPLKAIHEWGLIPKDKYPQVDNFDEYYQEVPEELKVLGKKFAELYTINYEKVYAKDMVSLLEKDMLGVAAYAWPSPINNIYPPSDLPINHAFLVWKPEYFAFDNYEDDPTDGAYIKQLHPQYHFYKYAYRVFITAENSKNIQEQISLIRQIINLLLEVIGLKKKQIEILTDDQKIEEITIKDPEPMPEPKYLWATPKEACHSVRVLCDEEGLSWEEKNIIASTVNCESSFRINATNKNTNGTTDWGICQYNDNPAYGWIGPDGLFKTPEECVANPEKAVRTMIRCYKSGQLKLWTCYAKKLYLGYKPFIS